MKSAPPAEKPAVPTTVQPLPATNVWTVAEDDTRPSTASKSSEQKPRPLPPEPRKRRHMVWRSDSGSRILRRRDFGRNKTLTCALVAEQSRTSPESSGSTAALDRVPIRWKGRKRGEVGGGKKKNRRKISYFSPMYDHC